VVFRQARGILMVVAVAALGYALIGVPPALVEGHHRAAALHRAWGVAYLIAVGTGILLLALTAAWLVFTVWRSTRRKRERRVRRGSDPSQLSRRLQGRELDENLEAGCQLAGVAEMAEDLKAEIRARVTALQAKRERQKLEIVAFGSISSGKSSLLNALAGRDAFRAEVQGGTTACRSEVPWPGMDRVVLVDTPGLAEVEGQVRAQAAAEAAQDADLVLFVVDGPLKDYELTLLKDLGATEKRILICLNKEDWFSADDRAVLLGQIADQVASTVDPNDVVTVRAQGAPRRRIRILPDGSEVEERLPTQPVIDELARRMMQIVRRDGQDLLLANLLLRSRGLVADAEQKIMAALDAKANERVHRAMWAAGSAVAINPFPLLDLAGGSAITVMLVLDLARVYRQEIDADTVVTLLAQLGKNLIAILGVTAVTPAVSAAVATTLKTVPGIGTIAGGLIQGLGQALVTLWIGKVFSVYFRNEMKFPAGGMAELAREKWREVTSADQLRQLIRTGRRQLLETEGEARDRTSGVDTRP
jgi:uncharacterized protein (DUF697 family)/GTP-binding protein EngB required for normal cell division